MHTLDGRHVTSLWDIEQDFVRAILRMESEGIRIDQDFCKAEIKRGEDRMESLYELLGYYSPTKPKDLHKLLIEEMGLPVEGWTKGGKPSFDKKAMEKYEERLQATGDKTAQRILEYRGWVKTISSNYKPYLDLVHADGKLRPNYKIHGPVTTRLSCEKPNLQQIPRESTKDWNGGLKKAFIPDLGYRLWNLDYSNLQLRIAAAYGEETELIKIFNEGRNLFDEMSAQIGWPRQDVKTFAYSVLFGAGIDKIMRTFNCSRDVAERMFSDWQNTYRGMHNAKMRAQAVCKRNNGVVKFWTGRKRHFENPSREYYKAFNAVIQGGEAEVVKRALIKVAKRIDWDECKLLLQVHDALVPMIREGKEDYWLSVIQEIMEDVEPPLGNMVKFHVDVKEWGMAA